MEKILSQSMILDKSPQAQAQSHFLTEEDVRNVTSRHGSETENPIRSTSPLRGYDDEEGPDPDKMFR